MEISKTEWKNSRKIKEANSQTWPTKLIKIQIDGLRKRREKIQITKIKNKREKSLLTLQK